MPIGRLFRADDDETGEHESVTRRARAGQAVALYSLEYENLGSQPSGGLR